MKKIILGLIIAAAFTSCEKQPTDEVITPASKQLIYIKIEAVQITGDSLVVTPTQHN